MMLEGTVEHPTPAVPAATAAQFEDFYLEEYRDLYASMWLVTRNRHEAEEIAQDSFLKVLERWEQVRNVDDPQGYLYRTAMNVWRSRRRRAAVALRKAVGATLRDDSIVSAEQRVDLMRGLAALTARQRAALVLTDLVGLTSDEAGKALGVRPSTVRVLAARGRASMKEGIER
jgi:RNA polymerase sigma-70 factor (ECF subfamily)